MVMFELIWLGTPCLPHEPLVGMLIVYLIAIIGFMWLMWLATGANTANIARINFSDGCNIYYMYDQYLFTDGQYLFTSTISSFGSYRLIFVF